MTAARQRRPVSRAAPVSWPAPPARDRQQAAAAAPVPGSGESPAAQQAGPGEFACAVLDVVDLIPAGRVMSYGDVAGYLGEGSPRQVGRVMALWGGAVSWWRVIRSDGSPPPGHERAALARYREESTPMRAGADGVPARVDMRRARWTGAP